MPCLQDTTSTRPLNQKVHNNIEAATPSTDAITAAPIGPAIPASIDPEAPAFLTLESVLLLALAVILLSVLLLRLTPFAVVLPVPPEPVELEVEAEEPAKAIL
jgi:hypothetical protein